MSWFWKGLVVLLLALPVGAYVTGSLTGAPADLPDRLEPVVVQDPSSEDTAPEPSTSDRPGTDGTPGGRDHDDGRDENVEVVRPDPDDLDDDSDDDGRDLDDDRDRDDPDDDVTDDD